MDGSNTGSDRFRLQDNFRFRLVLISCCVLFIFLREPALLLFPRLWAEEGTIFYLFARHHSVWDIFTTAHVGYLTLFNSIVSAIQAKVFPAEWAAIVSTYSGFLFQLIPVYIITFATHPFWDSPLKKIFYVFTLIAVMAPELWLNTTNSHFIFGLITFLIMIIAAVDLSKFQKYFFRLLLLVGGLTGPASIFFTPVFLLRAWHEKSKEKYIQAGILTLSAITQAGVIVYSLLFNNKYNRLSTYNFKTTIYHFIYDNFSLNIHLISHKLNFLFGLFIVVFYLYLLFKHRKNIQYLVFLLGYILVAVFSTLGSLNMAGSPRYAYIPTCICMLLLITEASKTKVQAPKIRYAILFILIACSICNIGFYRRDMKTVYNNTFPKWKNEVAKWRADSTYNPQIHPISDEWHLKM